MNNQYCKVKTSYKKAVVVPPCTSDKDKLCAPQPGGFGGVSETCNNCDRCN